MSRKWNRFMKKGIAWALTLAMVAGSALTDGVTLAVRAAEPQEENGGAAAINITASAGYEEGAYVEWRLMDGADGYQVYVAKATTGDEPTDTGDKDDIKGDTDAGTGADAAAGGVGGYAVAGTEVDDGNSAETPAGIAASEVAAVSEDEINIPDDAWVQLDEELIRYYNDGEGGNYMRADALGLTPGTWYLKIEAATFNSYKVKLETKATEVVKVTVTSHDRSGFAWEGNFYSKADNSYSGAKGTSSGAYNEDGSLKANAKVIYVTEKTKNKVSMEVKGASSNPCVGLQNIFNGYKQGQETTPLVVRFIGTVTDPAVLTKGDLVLENGRNSAGITIEGVGEDATLVGFGIQLQNASNVEIRNLGFMLCDSTEGDNVSLVQDNDHIWVHHCDFFYGVEGTDSDQKKGDGMLDCKKSNYVTFSYNHFWDSGKSCLLGLEENSYDWYITYHHNWFDHSDSRHPRVRFYSAHVYNNYYDGNAKYGVGATSGSSIFVENNYFRNCASPMLISMQGSDSGTFEKAGADGDVKENEDGGMIKAYGNEGVDDEAFKPYGEGTAAIDFDAYVVSDPKDEVPESVKTKKGDHTYNNFDTKQDNYISQGNYKLDEAKNVPTVVTENAGRLNGGDFTYEFDASADNSSAVDTVLKGMLEEYESSLISVGGILNASTKYYCAVTFDFANGEDSSKVVQVEINQPIDADKIPADPTVMPEGKVQFDGWYTEDPVTGKAVKWDFEDPVTLDYVTRDPEDSETSTMTMTLTAHYLSEDEIVQHGGTDIGTEKVGHNFVEQKLSSEYFAIDGQLYTKNGTSADYEGSVTGYGLIMDNAKITFTTTTERARLVLVMRVASDDKAKVDGVMQTATSGIIETMLTGAGEHVINGGSGYLFKIYVIPIVVTADTKYTITVDKADGSGETTTVEVPAGESLNSENLPTPVREGYTFTGWLDADGKEIYLPYEPWEDMTITATWLKNPSVTGGGDGTVLYNMKLIASELSGTYTEPVEKNGFTVLADSSHSVSVTSNNKTIEDVTYTSRLQTGSSGTKDYRSIKFTTEAAATLSIACLATSTDKTTNMGVATLDAQGNFVNYTGEVTTDGVKADCTDGKIPVTGTNPGRYITLELPKADTYYIYGQDGGINFYGIYVTYENGVDFATYTVKFNTMGGISVDSRQVQVGEKCAEPGASLRTGYTFGGWYADYDCMIPYDFDSPVYGDMMLFAKWTEGEAGTNLILDVKDLPTRSYGEPFEKNGFTFNAGSGKTMSVEDKTTTVDGTTYTKRLKLDGTGSASVRSVSFTVTENSTLTIVTESGSGTEARTLAVRNISSNQAAAQDIPDVSAAAKYTRDLEPGTWTIYSTNNGMNIYFVAVLPQGESVKTCEITVDKADGSAEEKITATVGVPVTKDQLPDPEREGYTFTGWVDGEGNKITVPFVPTGDMTLTATWTEGTVDTDDPSGRTKWNKVDKPVIASAEQFVADGVRINRIFVTATGDVSDKGADSLTVVITKNGKEVTSATSKDKKTEHYFDLEVEGNGTYTVTAYLQRTGEEDKASTSKTVRVSGLFSESGLHVELLDSVDGDNYIYSGSAIKPAIRVTNVTEAEGAVELVEGVDYTVKYKNNVNASVTVNEAAVNADDRYTVINEKKKPTIIVTGKGNFSSNNEIYFTIVPKDITNADLDSNADDGAEVKCGSIVIAENAKAAPVLVYNGKTLGVKDYDLYKDGNLEKNPKYDTAGDYNNLVIKGKGNFTGELPVDVKVLSKQEMKNYKFTVTVKTNKLTFIPGSDKIQEPDTITVVNKTTKEALHYNEAGYEDDYMLVYSGGVDAGTVKVTVIGLGLYSGSVTKSYKINPYKGTESEFKAVIVDKYGSEITSPSYEFMSTGVTLDDRLQVSFKKAGSNGAESELIPLTAGKDYKVTYSSNKKVGTAKYTITFLGNYKGTKALKGDAYTFQIIPFSLNYFEEGLKIVSPDKVFTKANTYISKPYVTLNGVPLKASDYTVSYFIIVDNTFRELGKKGFKIQEEYLDENGEITVLVQANGKGNYRDFIQTSYQVRKVDDPKTQDLSKAKVTFTFKDEKGNEVKKPEYTGEEIIPDSVTVTIKDTSGTKTLKEATVDEGGNLVVEGDFVVEYVNNVNKGKATAIIKAAPGSSYAGSKTATFSIVTRNLKNLKDLWSSITGN